MTIIPHAREVSCSAFSSTRRLKVGIWKTVCLLILVVALSLGWASRDVDNPTTVGLAGHRLCRI